jgi:hypothetical protein
VNVSSPRNLLIDNNGYLVALESNPPKLDRFDAQTLALINRTRINGSNALAVGFVNNAYYVGLKNTAIVVIDSGNLKTLNIIISPYILGVHDIIFLNNGRTMVVSDLVNGYIVFLNQSGNASSNYTFAHRQSVNYPQVHGLAGYNDSYFFATSYVDNSVYSYTAVENSTTWIERLFIDAISVSNISGGTFITIDECGRSWFALETSAVYIFDIFGSLVGNISLGSGSIIDTLVTDNYVVYFADHNTNWSRIIRIDPQIQC